MQIDLLAGTSPVPFPIAPLASHPTILVFDSGLGGLTVLAELRRARPDAAFVYAADDAAFPYGSWPDVALVERIVAVMAMLVEAHRPDLVVIACNTAATLVLPSLRARFAVPVVGTVPAIKPAVAASRSGRVSVIATAGTVARDYTRDLIATYAGACSVDLVASSRLAALAEAEMAGAPPADGEIAAEIAPCFRDEDGARTDVVVLACTHYPLLLPRLRALASWPVAWIDPAPAIARRVVQLLGPPREAAAEPASRAVFTGVGVPPALREALAGRGLAQVERGICPLVRRSFLT